MIKNSIFFGVQVHNSVKQWPVAGDFETLGNKGFTFCRFQHPSE